MTHVSTPIFQGLFKNIVFRSVAVVIKKLWAILDFFYTLQTFHRPVPYPMRKKKNNKKKSFKLLLMKSQKISRGDSVTNESARAKKTIGGGRQISKRNLVSKPPELSSLMNHDFIFKERICHLL